MPLPPFLSEHCDLLNQNSSSVLSPFEMLRALNNIPSDLNIASNLFEMNNDSVKFDSNQFQTHIDVQQFRPEDISVKISGNTITVECQHGERQDGNGFISRQFVRRYIIPEEYDIQKLQCKLSSDGVLSIVAPKKEDEKEQTVREIPITMTGPIQGAKRQSQDNKDADKEDRLVD